MFNFNSERPKKQGTKYGISLGQNDGPYLVKDMMLTNHKSAAILASSQSARPHGYGGLGGSTSSLALQAGRNVMSNPPPKVYDEQLGVYTNYDETHKTQLTASESLGIGSVVQNEQIKKLKELLYEYKEIVSEYKESLKAMNKRINEDNIGNLGDLQPGMKGFHEDLKSQLQETKNENYQLQREIDQLNRDKTQIQQQIAFSEKRIMDLEKFMGVSAKLDESDISETLDFQ